MKCNKLLIFIYTFKGISVTANNSSKKDFYHNNHVMNEASNSIDGINITGMIKSFNNNLNSSKFLYEPYKKLKKKKELNKVLLITT